MAKAKEKVAKEEIITPEVVNENHGTVEETIVETLEVEKIEKEKAPDPIVEEVEEFEPLVGVLPAQEDLITNGISYHIENREVYFSVKELKKKYPSVSHNKADERKFDIEGEKFTGIKAQNLFV